MIAAAQISEHSLIMSFFLELISKMALAAVPAFGFGMAFHVPPSMLKYCAIGGALGFGFRLVLLHLGIPVEWSTLMAAFAVSMLGIQAAQRLKTHPKAFTVAAMIPMIPGVSFFTALLALGQIHQRGYTPELFAVALSSGLRTLFVVSALAVGLAMPGLIFYRKRPVV